MQEIRFSTLIAAKSREWRRLGGDGKLFLLLFLFAAITAQSQIITTVAGNGSLGYSGDSGLATAAKLHLPGKAIVDASGNLYIADTWGHRIRKVDHTTGIITTIAGTGVAGYNSDGIPATSAKLHGPCGLAFDTSGNLYIADNYNQRVRKIDASTGIISTVAGTGYGAGGLGAYNGDGIPATSAELNAPGYIAMDAQNNLYISDGRNNRIRKVDASTCLISTIAGNGIGGSAGDSGGMATSAELYCTEGIAFVKGRGSEPGSGSIYVAADSSYTILKVDLSSGIITIVAGNGTYGYSGDSNPATTAQIQAPYDVAFDALGNYYIAEFKGRVRKVDTFGIIHTVAGTDTFGYNGDGILADTAKLNETTGVFVDGCGNLLIADVGNERIRKVTFDTSCTPSLGTFDVDSHNTISVYPNPVHDMLHVDNVALPASYKIVNVVGSVMQEGTLKQSNQLFTKELPEGVYVLEVRDGEGTKMVKKIVKE